MTEMLGRESKKKRTILFLDDIDYAVPALTHALGLRYRDIVLAKAYTTIDGLVNAGTRLMERGNVDAIGLDVSEFRNGRHDMTFGAAALGRCREEFLGADDALAKRVFFMTRWWPDQINSELGSSGPANPYCLGSGIVLPKPVGAVRLLCTIAQILGEDWSAEGIEPDITVCGATSDLPLSDAMNLAVLSQSRESQFRYTYQPIPSVDHYEVMLDRLRERHILLLDRRFRDARRLLDLARQGSRPWILRVGLADEKNEVVHAASHADLQEDTIKGFVGAHSCTCVYVPWFGTEKRTINLPMLSDLYQAGGEASDV